MASSQHHVLMARLLAKGRLRHLQLIGLVADMGSIQHAAARVGMSQPAATHAIRDIEMLIGAQLFERHARGMRLTQKGQLVADYARNMLSSLYSVTEGLALLNDGAVSRLRLGAIPAAASSLLAVRLPDFIARNPGIHLSVEEGTRMALLPSLIKGEFDIIFCRPPDSLPHGFSFKALLSDESIIVSRPGHPLSRGEVDHRLESLADYPWIQPPDHTAGRAVFDALFRRLGVSPRVYPFSGASMPLAVMVAIFEAESALCLMPRSLAGALMRTGQIGAIALPAQGMLQPLGAIYPSDRLGAAGRALLHALQSGAEPIPLSP